MNQSIKKLTASAHQMKPKIHHLTLRKHKIRPLTLRHKKIHPLTLCTTKIRLNESEYKKTHSKRPSNEIQTTINLLFKEEGLYAQDFAKEDEFPS
jgi:hypothetical protein